MGFTLLLCLLLPVALAGNVTLDLFWGEGCPHCAKEKAFLEELEQEYPRLDVNLYEVYRHPENRALMHERAAALNESARGVPATFIGDELIVGYQSDETTGQYIRERVESLLSETNETASEAPVSLPFIGQVDAATVSLPTLTIILGAADSFNPCAFFVLFFLLSMLIYAKSRARMLIIGGTFVFFSGLVYFIFMSAWLNFFLIAGTKAFITVVAGIVALAIGAINTKDFFAFKQGPSLTISDKAKPTLFKRMRGLLKADSIWHMLAGTVVLAVTANLYELLCTAGFPMVYTRVLTLHDLSTVAYYLYLVLYNIIYIVPLLLIVSLFTLTLGSKKLTEEQGRSLKLVSGLMMLALGLVLVIRPELLNNVLASVSLIIGALLVALTIILTRRYIGGGKDGEAP